MYDRHTTDNQPTETDGASLSGEQSGTTPLTRMNAPAQSYQNGALDNTTDTGKTHMGNGNDTATPENTAILLGKGSDNSVSEQDKSEKLAASEQPNEEQVAVTTAEAETNVEPTEAQKEAGNYKKGNTFQTAASQPHGGISLYRDILANVLEETSAKTEPQQPNNAVSSGSSLSADYENGITSAEPNSKPTVSNSKDSDISVSEQEKSEKLAASEQPNEER